MAEAGLARHRLVKSIALNHPVVMHQVFVETPTPTAGLPTVNVPGLRINVPGRVLYAATHGRSIYRMLLP